MIEIVWPLITLFLMFGSFWFGLLRGWMRGIDAGIAEGSAIAVKETLEWCRSKFDIHITDYDINTAVEYLKK